MENKSLKTEKLYLGQANGKSFTNYYKMETDFSTDFLSSRFR